MRLMLFLFAALLLGCGDHYRYPCQNPKNWESAECKPPVCTVTQTCPDNLLKAEEMKGEVR
jgi:hypothetical protein